MSHKGKYTPKNPQKYKGDSTNIVFRSSWELQIMQYLDNHNDVLWWASEELAIPYISPVDNLKHRYYPDFIFCLEKNNTRKVHMWEIKPYKQTIMPKPRKKTQKYIQECATFSINQEKWRAADIFCQKQGWEFKVITEEDLPF